MVLILALLLAWSSAQAEPLLGARRPCPSPDGESVAFDYQGDIWEVAASGGLPRRLTANEASDWGALYSPDGQWIAFNSDREGGSDVFVMPAEGGSERRLTFHSAGDYAVAWEPDGLAILTSTYRYEPRGQIDRVPLDGSLPVPIVSEDVNDAVLSPDGRRLAVSIGGNPWWRKHYRGSAGGEIWVRDLGDASWARITTTPDDERFPCWSPGGDSLFFVLEADSVPNIHCVNLHTKTVTRLTTHDAYGARFPRTSRTGVILYEHGHRLWTLEPPYRHPRELVIERASDCPGSSSAFLTETTASAFAVSRDEKSLALVARGTLVGVPLTKDRTVLSPRLLVSGPMRVDDPVWHPKGIALAYASDRGGAWNIYELTPDDGNRSFLQNDAWNERRLTGGPGSDRAPAYSPDGAQIAFIRNERQLCRMKRDGSDVRMLVESPGITGFFWSPDSRFIAYSATTLEWREDVFVVPASGGEPLQITRHPNDDYSPQWDPKGRWISFASRTSEGEWTLKMVFLTQGEFEKTKEDRLLEAESGADSSADEITVIIEPDEIFRRVRTITTVRGDYYPYSLSTDGGSAVFKATTFDGNDLFVVDVWDEKRTQVTTGGLNPESFSWGPTSGRVFYRTPGGAVATVDKEGKERTSLGFSVRLRVNRATERRQMLDEAWRLLRDRFYDPAMHGVDWQSVHDNYAHLIDPCATEPEFHNLLRQMIGELGASHLGVWREGTGIPATGELGIIPDPLYRGEGVRVDRVVRRSPAWMRRSRIEPGEIILKVDGAPVPSAESFFDLLRGTAGHPVLLSVKGSGARAVRITPIDPWPLRTLLREERVETLRDRVDSLSGGRVGYLYIKAMGDDDWLTFQRDFLGFNYDKDALIIDVRGNTGGNIHDKIIAMLAGRPFARSVRRNGRETVEPALRWDKPLAVLIDEGSYSDGEIFPTGIKTLGLGTLVGVPTHGAVIGTNDVKLLDGTTFRVPTVGWWRVDGTNMENNGIEPDVYVERMPEEHRFGRDSQLQRAVAVMMEALGRN
ncbi:PD40 domain-containing protein [Candidatus Fermentibacteria bacterium]|nr:PD40 domain-containing protein [Candidatus Fermentibacteria bacterium]